MIIILNFDQCIYFVICLYTCNISHLVVINMNNYVVELRAMPRVALFCEGKISNWNTPSLVERKIFKCLSPAAPS